MLSCRAAGSPAPNIKWSKDGAAVQTKNRFVIVQSGTLKIDGKRFFFFVNVTIEEGRRDDLFGFSLGVVPASLPAVLSCEFAQRSQ